MSDKLPRSIQPHLHPTLHRKKFFVVSDTLAQQAAVNTSGVNGSQVQRLAQEPGLLQMEQIPTLVSLPVRHSNGKGRHGYRQFQIPSLLQPEQMQTTTPLPAVETLAMPVMQSEISGAANSAAIVGVGFICLQSWSG